MLVPCEETAEPGGEATKLHFVRQLWSWALVNDGKDKMTNRTGRDEFPPRVLRINLRHKVRGSDIWEALKVQLLQVEKSQLRWLRASGQRASWTPFVSIWKGKTWGRLEGLYLSAGPATSWDFPREAGGSGWGEKRLSLTAEAATTVTWRWWIFAHIRIMWKCIYSLHFLLTAVSL